MQRQFCEQDLITGMARAHHTALEMLNRSVNKVRHQLSFITQLRHNLQSCTDPMLCCQVTEDCGLGGSPRRCGGQGDVLSGSLATFLHWASRAEEAGECSNPGAEIIAAWGAARLTRACAELAFTQCGRSSTTTDMIGVIHQVSQ